MPELQRPKVEIVILKGKKLSDEIKDIAKRQGIDLANMEETKEILKNLPTSISDEIVNRRKLKL